MLYAHLFLAAVRCPISKKCFSGLYRIGTFGRWNKGFQYDRVMGIQTPLLLLVMATELANWQTKAINAEHVCNTSCKFVLEDQRVEGRKFSSLDYEKVQKVFLSFNTKNETYITDHYLQNVVWVHSHSSPFLDERFEIFSLTTLSPSVSFMTLQARLEPKGCFDNLTAYCRNFSVASAVLRYVTRERGAACFGHRFIFHDYTMFSTVIQDNLGVRHYIRCCELRNDDLECDLTPQSSWDTHLKGFYTSLYLVILSTWPLLFFLLPETADGIESQVPLIALSGPNPMSLSNVFVRCFSNQPEHDLVDKFKRFLSRMIVFWGLFPSIIYLYITVSVNSTCTKLEGCSIEAKGAILVGTLYFCVALIVAFTPTFEIPFNHTFCGVVIDRNFSVSLQNGWKSLKLNTTILKDRLLRSLKEK